MKNKPIHSIGRRKEAVARVFLRPGSGEVQVNGKALDAYFPTPGLRSAAVRPLFVVGKGDQFDVMFNISGGGSSGQAGAASLALARALVKSNEEGKEPALKEDGTPVISEWKSMLRAEGLLTVDSRVVERKKYGRHKARKKSQYSKR